MIQLHSTPISEPVAHVCGLGVGLAAYGLTGVVTGDHNARLWAGMVASMLTNVVVGAKVNLALLDLLALIVVRPLSAAAGAPILVMVANVLSQ